ncbi:triacylglycerol lipase, partial [Ostertagia ostertagi]
MPQNDCLTPTEASYIATNAYFTLKDWISGQPTAGVETRANVHNRVLGAGTAGVNAPGQANPSLQGTALRGADLGKIFSGTTGINTQSGFGYLLQFKQGTRRHIVVATRGTRPELGAPDLLTDARGAMTGFGDFGPVHKGFRRTFDTCMTSIGTDERLIMDADVVHCVGHSLGGAVATLIAAHFAALKKDVKLYTFGSPRVGAFGTFSAFHRAIKQENIFRVAHDLDPISLHRQPRHEPLHPVGRRGPGRHLGHGARLRAADGPRQRRAGQVAAARRQRPGLGAVRVRQDAGHPLQAVLARAEEHQHLADPRPVGGGPAGRDAAVRHGPRAGAGQPGPRAAAARGQVGGHRDLDRRRLHGPDHPAHPRRDADQAAADRRRGAGHRLARPAAAALDHQRRLDAGTGARAVMSSLAPEQLAYIVTHGELLVMLSLRRLEMMLDASAEDAPAPSAEELAAAEAVTLAELARQQQQWLTQSVDVAPVADAHVTLAAAALPDGHVDLGPEIEDALAHAYASIPARTQALQGADTASLVLA